MCESIPATLMVKSPTIGLIGRFGTIIHDFDGQLSWGRVCSCVALAMAVVERHSDIQHVALWLGAAMGHYTASKITEMISGGNQ